MAKFTITDPGVMRQRLQLFSTKFPKKVARAMVAEMKVDMKISQGRTPYRTGALHDSHQVTEPEIQGTRVRVGITVGGVTALAPEGAPYAVYVHEDPDAHHPVGEWKFLEKTLRESRPTLAQRIGRRLRIDPSDL